MKLRVGNAAILAYRRLPYKTWYALAEFVDNSTDAFLRPSNRTALETAYREEGEGGLQVEVVYDKDNGILRINDNSIGMSAEELEAAMEVGLPPVESAGRSEFGMGMKTAAIWFSDKLTITTKKLGESEEIRVTLDVARFVNGDDELEVRRVNKSPELHYTRLELANLQRRLGPAALRKTEEFLGSIYREDLRAGTLELTINGSSVEPPPSRDADAFLKRTDDSPYLVDVDEKINGHPVTGWVGVLAPGHSGRSRAGIALIRHGRAVRGWLDSWRPEEIFGDARNDLKNQRIAGELHVDQFKASHTKDAIDWQADEEEELGERLKQILAEADMFRAAKQRYRGDPDASVESEIEHREAQAQLAEQMRSEKVQDTIRLLDVPSPDRARLATEVLIEATADADPVAIFDIGGDRRALVFEIAMSPNDPYFEYEVQANKDLRVAINAHHPAIDLLATAEARLAHYHHVILDAIAEWKCAQQRAPLEPSSIRLMKDQLFRSVVDSSEALAL